MSATVLPHPALSGAQLEHLCRREGLAVEHLGDAIFRLVQTSAPRENVIRIARPRYELHPDPEAA